MAHWSNINFFITLFIFIINRHINVVFSNFIFQVNNFTLPIMPGVFNTIKPGLPNDKPKTEGGNFNICSCKSAASCPADGYWNVIDIRIVTPPVGVECGPGQIYCCISGTDCGSNRIIQVPDTIPKPGQSDFGEYPWQALILSLNNDYVGSGALITNAHVITAAHRLTYFSKKGQQLFVRLGDWDLQGIKEPYPFTDVLVSQIIIHPQYDSITLQYDVAILMLSTPVTIAPNINTVCLPSPNTCFIGQTCWVSGWGKDMFGPSGNYQVIQKKVDVMVLNPSECDQRLSNTKLGPKFSLDQQSFLCAGGSKGKDACTGDGGSPLVCQNADGHWTLVGLVAWGLGCAESNIPGVYVNIPKMINWIHDQIQQPIFNKR